MRTYAPALTDMVSDPATAAYTTTGTTRVVDVNIARAARVVVNVRRDSLAYTVAANRLMILLDLDSVADVHNIASGIARAFPTDAAFATA